MVAVFRAAVPASAGDPSLLRWPARVLSGRSYSRHGKNDLCRDARRRRRSGAAAFRTGRVPRCAARRTQRLVRSCPLCHRGPQYDRLVRPRLAVCLCPVRRRFAGGNFCSRGRGVGENGVGEKGDKHRSSGLEPVPLLDARRDRRRKTLWPGSEAICQRRGEDLLFAGRPAGTIGGGLGIVSTARPRARHGHARHLALRSGLECCRDALFVCHHGDGRRRNRNAVRAVPAPMASDQCAAAGLPVSVDSGPDEAGPRTAIRHAAWLSRRAACAAANAERRPAAGTGVAEPGTGSAGARAQGHLLGRQGVGQAGDAGRLGRAVRRSRVRHTLAFGQELNHRTDTACTPLLNDQGAGWKTCPLVRNGQPGWPQPSGRIFWRFTLLLLRLPK